MGLASAQRFRGQPAVGPDVNLRSYADKLMWSISALFVLLYASITKPSAIFSMKRRRI